MLRLELFLIGAYFFKSVIFDDKGSSWGMERILILVVGMGLPIISIVIISLTKMTNHPGREIFSRYLVQASLWSFLSLFIIESTLRLMIYNPPLRRDVTNWAGDIPGVHSLMLWGKEGYAVTQYEKWGEIRTPFHDNKKDNNIIVLGDSQTECLQVADELKFTSVAETVLRQSGYNADLHNLGRSGLAMADYISWIPAYQSLYKPKLIVIQLTLGDFIESFHEGQFNYFVVQDDHKIDLVQTYDLSSGFTQTARNDYYLASQIKELGYQRWQVMQGAIGNNSVENANTEVVENIPSENVDTEAVTPVLTEQQNVNTEIFTPELADQQMKMLIDASGGTPLIVVLLPSAPYISGNEIQMADPAHEQLKEFIKQYPDITLVDPLPEFQKLASTGHPPRGFFNSAPDTGHLNQYGNELVGRLLAKAIEQALK
jgi:lysophospholipase L1-like esterase